MQFEDIALKAATALASTIAALSAAAVYQYRQGIADHKERVADLTSRCTNLERLLADRDAALMKCKEEFLAEARMGKEAAAVLADAVAELRELKARKGIA